MVKKGRDEDGEKRREENKRGKVLKSEDRGEENNKRGDKRGSCS